MPQKYQVASKQRSGGLIQNRKIIVGVRRLPSLEHQDSIAQIDPRLALDDLRWRNDFDICHQFVAEYSSKGIEIELAASSERSREVFVADDHSTLERSVPEDVIGMGMGVDDVPNRLRRHCADGCKQSVPFAHASPAVNHRDSVAADDKSDICGCALVLPCHHGNGTDVGIQTRCDLSHGQRIGRFARPSSRHDSQQRRCQGQNMRSRSTDWSIERHLAISRISSERLPQCGNTATNIRASLIFNCTPKSTNTEFSELIPVIGVTGKIRVCDPRMNWKRELNRLIRANQPEANNLLSMASVAR